jgi:hypothetical protein
MRTTVNLPEPLIRSAKRRAASRGVTLSDVIEDALRGHLAAKPSASVPPFRLHTVRGKLVDVRIDLDRTSALLLLDDEAEYRPKTKR